MERHNVDVELRERLADYCLVKKLTQERVVNQAIREMLDRAENDSEMKQRLDKAKALKAALASRNHARTGSALLLLIAVRVRHAPLLAQVSTRGRGGVTNTELRDQIAAKSRVLLQPADETGIEQLRFYREAEPEECAEMFRSEQAPAFDSSASAPSRP
jgi:hypothetical protein